MHYCKAVRPLHKEVLGAVPFRPAHPQHATHWLVPRWRMAVPYHTSNFPAKPAEDATPEDKHRYAAFAAGVYLEDEVVQAALSSGVPLWDWLQAWLGQASPCHDDPDRAFAACIARLLSNVDGRVQTSAEVDAAFVLRRATLRASGVEPSAVQISHEDDTGGPDNENVFEDSDDDSACAHDAPEEPDRDPEDLIGDPLPQPGPLPPEDTYISNLLAPLAGVSVNTAATDTVYDESVVVPGSDDARLDLQETLGKLKAFKALPEESAPVDKRFVLLRDPVDNALKPAYSYVPRPPPPAPDHYFEPGKVPYVKLDRRPSIEDTIEVFTLKPEQAVPFAILAQALLNRVRGNTASALCNLSCFALP